MVCCPNPQGCELEGGQTHSPKARFGHTERVGWGDGLKVSSARNTGRRSRVGAVPTETPAPGYPVRLVGHRGGDSGWPAGGTGCPRTLLEPGAGGLGAAHPHRSDTRRSPRLGLDELAVGGWGARALVLSVKGAVCVNER